MNTERTEIPVSTNIDGTFTFDYDGKTYDCSHLVERDKEVILREADDTHKGVVDELYIRDSLAPARCKVHTKDDEIVYLMLVYTIQYRVGGDRRTACGDCYPFCEPKEGVLFPPYPYQGSICW